MDRKKTKLLRFALSVALCGVPAISIGARAQDQTPPPEQDAREKKQTGQEEGKKNRPADTKTSNRAAQTQAPERRDHPAETQPRNGSAERQAQERQNRPAEERPRNEGAPAQNRGAQVAQGGSHRAAPNAHYQFRQQDTSRLRQHFQSQLAHVDRHNRPHVAAGGYLAGNWQTYIVPVPVDVVTYLPPPPEGYELAFYDGYIIVYDPSTGLVLDVIDLLD
jgi:hypothetical protein